eukprot:6018430-Heterocapsa_arctica.AAC.1
MESTVLLSAEKGVGNVSGANGSPAPTWAGRDWSVPNAWRERRRIARNGRPVFTAENSCREQPEGQQRECTLLIISRNSSTTREFPSGSASPAGSAQGDR